jgi:hypothetical protein
MARQGNPVGALPYPLSLLPRFSKLVAMVAPVSAQSVSELLQSKPDYR